MDDYGRDGEVIDISELCKVSDDGTGVMSYESSFGHLETAWSEEDNDIVTTWDFNPGEYYEFLEEKPTPVSEKHVDLFRVLTKEDMEDLPDGTVLDDEVMHY